MLPKARTFPRNAVATEHPMASAAGLEAITAGGNAFDAAVAASFALGVVLPHTSGLGGDFFALFREARTGKVRCLNGSGWSPSGLTVERLSALGEESMPTIGPRSAVIPGMPFAVHELHKKFGRLEFGSLVAPAAKLARDGFPVSPSLAGALNRSPEARHALLSGAGAVPGEVLRTPRLAATLAKVAEEEMDGFYAGEVAEGIQRAIALGGIEVEPSDISEFRPEWVDPIQSTYRGRRVYEVPPNSMGAETLLILKILEETEPPAPDSAERIRMSTEATKVAWSAKEERLGDPRFVRFDLGEFLSYRSSSATGGASGDDTTYFAVADEEGNLLSCIQSIFRPFGSGVYLDGGFFLNNRASSFRFEGPNRAGPRKRPVHTLSSLLVSEGQEAPVMAVGMSAAQLRPQLHALLVTNLVDYSMGLERSLSFPRFAWNGEAILIEPGFRTAGLDASLVESNGIGVAQGLELRPGSIRAVCDTRGDGAPAGD